MINLLDIKNFMMTIFYLYRLQKKIIFSQLRSLIESFQDNSKCKLIIYDIGLEKSGRDIKKEYKDIEIRTFDLKNILNLLVSILMESWETMLGNQSL